jgi:hypothetical protein
MDSRKTYWFWILVHTNDLRFDNMPAMIYNNGMTEKYTQLRIWQATLKKLRRIYAETGESMIAIVDRLATEELDRIQNDYRQDVQIQVLPVEKE